MGDADALEPGRADGSMSPWGSIDDDNKLLVARHYGGIGRTMLTLFLAISGGKDWGEAAKPVAHLAFDLSAVWVIYIFCMLYGLLNVVVGIFCESALQSVQNSR